MLYLLLYKPKLTHLKPQYLSEIPPLWIACLPISMMVALKTNKQPYLVFFIVLKSSLLVFWLRVIFDCGCKNILLNFFLLYICPSLYFHVSCTQSIW